MIFISNYIKQNLSLLCSMMLSFFVIFPNSAKSENLEVRITADTWPPFRMIKDNKYVGIDYDILNEVAKRMNLQLTIKQQPWSRGLASMQLGQVDIMSGLAKTEKRALFLNYTSPSYFKCSTVFYVKKGDAKLIQNYEDLQQYNIGYVSNSAYFKKFDTDKNLKKYPVTNEEQLIKMLIFNRFKVIIGTDCQADYDISRLGFNEQIEKAIFKPNNSVHLYIGISKKSKLINKQDQINKVIKDIIEEGLVQEYSKKYY